MQLSNLHPWHQLWSSTRAASFGKLTKKKLLECMVVLHPTDVPKPCEPILAEDGCYCAGGCFLEVGHAAYIHQLAQNISFVAMDLHYGLQVLPKG